MKVEQSSAAVGVRPDPPGFGLLEGKGEGLEQLWRAEPDEAVDAFVDVDAKRAARIAGAAVRPVGGDDQIPLGLIAGVVLALELTTTPSASARLVGSRAGACSNAEKRARRANDGRGRNVDVVPSAPPQRVRPTAGRADQMCRPSGRKRHAPAEVNPSALRSNRDVVATGRAFHRMAKAPRRARAEHLIFTCSSWSGGKRSTTR